LQLLLPGDARRKTHILPPEPEPWQRGGRIEYWEQGAGGRVPGKRRKGEKGKREKAVTSNEERVTNNE